MAREMINENDIEMVVGGSIVFSPDHKTCGLNCNNQAKVNNYGGCLNYISEHYKTMSEGEMLRNMAAQGLITRL